MFFNSWRDIAQPPSISFKIDLRPLFKAVINAAFSRSKSILSMLITICVQLFYLKYYILKPNTTKVIKTNDKNGKESDLSAMILKFKK